MNKLTRILFAILITSVIYDIILTVISVREQREIEVLKEELTEYKDKYHGCLQGKMRLNDNQTYHHEQ